MALDPLLVTLELDQLVCYDEGDSGANAEPYFLTVFFEVDGDTTQLSDPDITLAGSAVVKTILGTHGNLGRTIKAGQTAVIPDSIGRYSGRLKGIPVAQKFQDAGGPPKIAGAVGAVVVLMEQDLTSDNAANAAHNAFNISVRNELNRIVDSLGMTNPEVTNQDINAAAKRVRTAVKNAVINQGGFFQDIANLLNKDDFLGTEAFIFTHTELEQDGTRNFSARFRPQGRGDWELKGHVTATPTV
jgi:hypothetical protein